MILYSQRDQRWTNSHLGPSQLTVGRYGCLETSLCMLASYFGKIITPDMVAEHVECFDPNGEYQWNFPDFPFLLEKRFDGINSVEIMKSLKDPKRGVVLQVDNGQHFVLALSKNWFGSYKIADPWIGDTCDAVKRWHNITGSRHLVMK